LRANISCPGYHDPKNLVFRDETKSVVRRATAGVSTPPPAPIVLPLDLRAKFWFVSQYVLGDSSAYDYMQTFYPPRPSMDCRHLTAAVRAASLAFLSNEHHSPLILESARKMYCSALILLNKALSSPHLATQNITLLAVLLLHLFEHLIKRGEVPLEPETKHNDGAIAIVRLRGSDQFSTEAGKRMFLQLCSNVILNCIKREVPVPPELIALRTNASRFMDTSDPRWRLHSLMIRFASLRSAMRNGELPTSEFLEQAKTLDDEYLAICSFMGPKSRSELLENTDCRDVALGSSHVHLGRSWNSFRVARALFGETVQRYSLAAESAVPNSPE